MTACGGAKKRKVYDWSESESSRKEREFRSILDYNFNSPDLKVSLVHRIAISKSLSPPLVVYDMDWNPMPHSCKGKNTIAMLACASSYGAHIYYYPRATKTWTTVVMNNRPTRKGESIRWHETGLILATTSNPSSEKCGNVTVFSYDKERLCFDATSIYKLVQDRKVSSLAWIPGSGVMTRVHKAMCNGFPTESSIILQPHPPSTTFFAACEDGSKILIWSKQEGDDYIWSIIRSVDCERGIIGMQFAILTKSLITFQKGQWNVWHFDKQNDLKLEFTSLNEHKFVKGKRNKYRSELLSLGVCSTGKFVASGGSGDTFLVYARPTRSVDEILAVYWNPAYSRSSNFCYGEVRCVKFNPKDDANLTIATGSNKGFIHFWAIQKASRGKSKVEITPDRRYEHEYYADGLLPEHIRIPSTDDDEEEEEDKDVDRE